MSMIKKLIALTLALAMVLSVSAFAGYTADTYADADKISADCKNAVELMYALDIMVGDGKNFKPESAVTRAEMAKIIYVILNYGDDDQAVTYKGGKFFTDVEAGAWYEGYVNYCAATKLISGRGDGTFDPTAPVTTTEAAKMLLTAIGYSSEARGYTGAKWAENVLADATIIGLLNGYKANVNAAAPRQWIAVMLENLLLDALTYTTMAPSFSGLLTSGENTDVLTYPTMGYKYYGLLEFSKVAIATEDAYIAGDETASDDTVLFENGLEIEKTGLKAADLGQKYRVIYDGSDEDELVAYSVRSLSKTDEALIKDMDVTVKHATSSNKASNKYQFTIGDMVAYFETEKTEGINVLVTGGETDADIAYTTINVEELRALIDAPVLTPDVWKAIDTDVDGKIDYFFVTEYAYAEITEISTSNKYGKYLNMTFLGEDEVAVTFNGEENLYVKDCIITEDELEEEQIVKMSWSIDSGKYVVEVLPAEKGVEYKEYDDKNDVFVLGNKEYQVAETWSGYDCEDDVRTILEDDDYLGEELNIVYDGDLIVYVWEDDDNYDNMDKVNEQLVLVLDAMNQYSNNTIREKNAITYMDIKGDIYTKAYQDGEEYGLNFMRDIYPELADVEDNTKYDNDKADKSYTYEGRLFILHEGTKGRVWLEALSDDVDNDGKAEINEQLSVKTSVLNGYEEVLADELDATGKAVTYGDYKVDVDNKYFVGSFNSKGEAVYKIMTLDELKNCYDEEAYGQILTLTNSKGTRTTVVGGYIFMNLDSELDAGYLYIEKIGRVTADGRKCDVVFADGTEKTVVIANDADLYENILYSFSYNFMDDEYTVSVVTLPVQDAEIIDFDDDNYVWTMDDAKAKAKFELEDEVIAVLTVEIDRDNTNTEWEDEPEFEVVNKGIEFVALKDLKADMIVDDEDDKTYTQYTDYVRYADDLFYVVNFQIMDTAQEEIGFLPEFLEYFFSELTGAYYSTGKITATGLFTDGEESWILAELEELSYTNTLDLVLYCGDEVLTTAALNTAKYPAETELSGRIMVVGDSSSWTASEWEPKAEDMPTEIALVIDGVEVDRATVIEGTNGDTGEETELTAEAWAAFINPPVAE